MDTDSLPFPDTTHVTSSLLDKIQRNNATAIWSYHSECSTNYTESNRRGPGRNLGNLYSAAASKAFRLFGSRHRRSLPSPAPDGHQQDSNSASSVWSFHSEWSSNYTTSNLAGPGRILGNLYSLAAKPLERNLRKLAYYSGTGRHAEADRYLRESPYARMELHSEKRRMELCKTLLGYAQ